MLARGLRARFSSIDEDSKRFIKWLLVWVVLINFCFMIMWFIGAPTRRIEIVAVGLVGLIVKRFPWPLQATVFVLTMIACLMTFVGGLFNLSFLSIFHSLKFFSELQVQNSLEYVVVSLLLLATMALGAFLLRQDTNFTSPKLIIFAAIVIAGLSFTDHSVGQGMRGHYKRMASAETPFESAVQQSGFASRADGKRHLILIMVESLGVPVDNPEMSKRLFEAFEQPAVKSKYEIQRGTSVYYNSTTAGEVRELCGRWGDYYELVETADKDCLPSQLAAGNYDTQAIHSFQGDFFARDKWYPNIGFKGQQFRQDLADQDINICGGVFVGACDHEMPAFLAKTLKAAEKPTFLYWLTVNTHLPVPEGMNLPSDNCEKYSPVLARDFPMICRQFAIFDAVDRALVKEMLAKDFPDADILIVGDHMPPFFDRRHRAQFDPTRVPWIYLKQK